MFYILERQTDNETIIVIYKGNKPDKDEFWDVLYGPYASYTVMLQYLNSLMDDSFTDWTK